MAGKLLCAWMCRLYNPEVDGTITRVYELELGADLPTKPTFTIQDNGKELKGCKILKVGAPFDRRTTVFQTSEGKVIKEQYIELNCEYKEGLILQKIHEGGHFPGVVQYESYDIVKKTVIENTRHEPATSEVELIAVCEDEKRKKARLVMPETAIRLTDVEIPLEVLILAYDLLEGTLQQVPRLTSSLLHSHPSPLH